MKQELPFDPLGADQQASLVSRVARGDAGAERELVLLFQERILVMMSARTRDRELARDLTQDVLLAALTALRGGQLRQAERLAAFVYGIARNVVNSRFRAAASGPNYVPLEDDVEVRSAPDPVEQAERRAVLQRAFAVLGSTDRQILVLTLAEGLKPAEIAARLRLGVEAVRMRKSRAMRRLSAEVDRLLRGPEFPHYPGRTDDV